MKKTLNDDRGICGDANSMRPMLLAFPDPLQVELRLRRAYSLPEYDQQFDEWMRNPENEAWFLTRLHFMEMTRDHCDRVHQEILRQQVDGLNDVIQARENKIAELENENTGLVKIAAQNERKVYFLKTTLEEILRSTKAPQAFTRAYGKLLEDLQKIQ